MAFYRHQTPWSLRRCLPALSPQPAPRIRAVGFSCHLHCDALVFSRRCLSRSWSGPSSRHFSKKPPTVRYTCYGPYTSSTHRKLPTLVVVLATGGVTYYCIHLEQVPETGRWRFMDISPKYEVELGEVAHAELLREFKSKILPPHHPITHHIRRVVASILTANDLGTLKGQDTRIAEHRPSVRRLWGDGTPGADAEGSKMHKGREWNLLVVNDETIVNAMASYGNIIVFTGLLPVCKDEHGLAAVLGHEIGHVVARHPSERYSRSKILIFAIYLLAALGLDPALSAAAVRFLIDLPNSRTQELEADKIGLRLSARACFNPQAAAEMHQRLDTLTKKQGRSSGDFLNTHPAGEKRAKLLTEMLPEAYALRAASPQCGLMQRRFDAFRGALGLGRTWP